jgi:hypothetical protein
MVYALVSPNETIENGFKIVNVVVEPFQASEPMFWVEWNDNITSETHYYVPESQTVEPIPVEE